MSSTTGTMPPEATVTSSTDQTGLAQRASGMSLVALVTALGTALAIFAVQIGFFLLLRNKLARIFKPKTFLVPERERTEPPPRSPWGLIGELMKFQDREIIRKCGLDAYFFLRYLQTLLVIFVPIALICIPVLVPINFIGGYGHSVVTNTTETGNNSSSGTDDEAIARNVTGLDTLAWGNIRPVHNDRRWAHLILALCVIVWVCYVFFVELKVYIKVRQDYLTSAEHRLRASANTVLVSEIPGKWYTEEALRGLFDVFPGGIRNIWLTRDFTKLLEKIHKRDNIHKQLESAETDLIKSAKKRQLKLKAAQEKKDRKEGRVRAISKAEQSTRDKQADAEAIRRAQVDEGLSAGVHEEVPHNVARAVNHDQHTDAGSVVDDRRSVDELEANLEAGGEPESTLSKVPVFGKGLATLGLGLKKGVEVVGGVGQGVLGGVKTVQRGVDGELEWKGGFDFVNNQPVPADEHAAASQDSEDRRRVRISDPSDNFKSSFASDNPLTHASHPQDRPTSGYSAALDKQATLRNPTTNIHDNNHYGTAQFGNTTRKLTNIDEMYIKDQKKWYQFWKPPSGGYASPVPQGGGETAEFPFDKKEKTFWQNVKSKLPFVGDDDDEVHYEYPKAYEGEWQDIKEEGAAWEKWLKPGDRPNHRLARFNWTPGWLPGLPFLNQKVDTIYWCRAELARLNVEIEEDQAHPERFPVMNSAFIQFNHQVAAHMACQSVTHHVPKRMAPRIVEISPDDVLWDNMAIKWWVEWAKKFIVFLVVVGMVLLWALPVAWTASLSQIDTLIEQYKWLGFLKTNPTVYSAVKAIAGVLPAILLGILLSLVPLILNFLAVFQGCKTGSQKAEMVQFSYFIFLFVQVTLVVSISSTTWSTIEAISKNVTSTPTILANNLPRAANYFFSYMILQALSVSSGTLLQIGTLFAWYVLSRILDSTARAKWRRNTELNQVKWGSFFPVYTNFACIALIFSVIAPLISLFAIITFSLFWVTNRYNMLYVTRFRTDTGGVLYPRAINQTFTGLYFMELCMIGLFLGMQDGGGTTGLPQTIIMVIALLFTALFQFLMNRSFGPLLRYLPITFEDEAVLRDEAFQRAQDRRLGLLGPEDDEAATLKNHDRDSYDDDIEMREISQKDRTYTEGGSRRHKLNPVKGIRTAGTWAAKGGKKFKHVTLGKAEDNLRNATEFRKQRRLKDLEAQRAMGEALYGGYHDEIEDLTPEERDQLVKKAFQHYALRARQPVVWIPRDDLGVSDDEILRTRDFSDYIWISNEGTALDSKVRVVYGRNPPDFSEVDIINL